MKQPTEEEVTPKNSTTIMMIMMKTFLSLSLSTFLSIYFFFLKFHNGDRSGIIWYLQKTAYPRIQEIYGVWKKKDRLPKISRSSYDEYRNLDKTGTKIFSTDVRRLTLAEMLQSLITLEAASENHLVIGIIQKDKDYDILDRC